MVWQWPVYWQGFHYLPGKLNHIFLTTFKSGEIVWWRGKILSGLVFVSVCEGVSCNGTVQLVPDTQGNIKNGIKEILHSVFSWLLLLFNSINWGLWKHWSAMRIIACLSQTSSCLLQGWAPSSPAWSPSWGGRPPSLTRGTERRLSVSARRTWSSW